MQQSFVIPIGRSLIAASLPAGQIASVAIDNPSATWLQLFPGRDLIPPFTLGYARSFRPTITNLDVRAIKGPTTPLLTDGVVGDPVMVILNSEPIGFSAGVPMTLGGAVRAAAATFRTIGNAAATQNIMQLRAATTKTNIALRRAFITLDTPDSLAAISCIARLRRVLTISGGTTLTKTVIDTRIGNPQNNIDPRGATASDGGVLLPLLYTASSLIRQRFIDASIGVELWGISDAPIFLDTNDFSGSAAIIIESALATDNPASNQWLAEMEWDEYPSTP